MTTGVPITMNPESPARLLVLTQVRDLAAVLRREADALREAAARTTSFALTMNWRGTSAQACQDELQELTRRLVAFAQGYDEASLIVLAHAEQAESAAQSAVTATSAAATYVMPPL